MRIFFIVLAMYLIGDGVIHLLNIRLGSVINVWPTSAVSYAILLDSIYASFVFLAAALILVAQTDLKKYKSLIFVSGIWAIFHGTLLFYNQYLFFEAILAFIYAIVVFLRHKKL